MSGRPIAGSRLRGALALAGTLALIGAVQPAPAASAAETVVGFDHFPGGGAVPVGTVVTNQWEAEGLKLGKAEAFGQGSPGAGDCGAPTVQGDAVNEPPSTPNYAILANCKQKPGEAESSGTYGALLDHPTGALSVDVRDIVPGLTVVQVKITAYDGEGEPLTTAEGEAGQGKWTHLTLSNPAKGKISYFAIATTKPSPDTIAIDNLSFEKVEEETKEKEKGGGEEKKSGGGSTTPTPPTAAGTVVTPNPHGGSPVTLSGAGSSPGSGHIISYEWDFNSDGKIDTSTGTNPIAHVILPTGIHTIGLTVTNSGGEKSSSKFGLVLQGVSIPPNDGGEGPCLTSLEVANAELLAECIQKKSSGEYVVESKELGLNGMVLVPPGGGYGVYHVTSHRRLGIGTEYKLSGTPVNIELLNTPIGDMTLGGYDLETEPVTIGTAFEKREVLKVTAPLRAHAADEERVANLKGTPLMSFGVGKPCTGGEKKVGCCPPEGPTKACATLPGNFPLTGMVSVYLTSKGEALFDVQVGLNLSAVNFEATGELELLSSQETGIELSTLRFTIPEASLKPIFKVKEASFVYYFPGNPDPEKRDTWQAKATITFGLLNEPGLEGELSFQHGQFHSAGMTLILPPPGIPLYPGISLNKIGAMVGVEPLEFGGNLGAKVAAVLELELAFKYSDEGGGHLGFFGGRGTLKYEENEIATLEGDVYSDGYSDALLTLKIGVPFGSKEPVVSAEGEIGYWDEPSSGLWEAYGRVHIHVWVIDAEVAGLVNNHYIAGCGFVGPFGALGYWSFDTSSVGGEGFFGGNCHDDLKPYKQVPLTHHEGGFVNETETESLRGRPPSGAFAAVHRHAGDATIAVASNSMGRDLRISSNSGTPIVKLIGPNGQSYTTPSQPGKVSMTGNQFIAALGSNPHNVIVYLSTPAGGEWHLKRAPGSAPISKVEEADVSPPPSIKATVRHRGKHWALSYRTKNLLAGTKVRFYERGKDSIHGLGTVSAAKGSVAFTPTEALGRARKIYATVIAATGVPSQTVTVTSYSAPRPFRPGRPAHAHFLRRGKTAVLSWGAVNGAKVYRVKVTGSDGRIDTFFAKPSHRSETLPGVLATESFKATITAVGGKDLLEGRPVSVRLKPLKIRTPKKPSSSKRRAGKRKR
jgi:PKD repeat protein